MSGAAGCENTQASQCEKIISNCQCIHYQYLICVRTLYLRHTKPISKSNPKPHCTGSTLSFWYKHVDCPLKEGCWVCLIKDHRPDYGEDSRNVLCIVDSRVYLVYADECGNSDAHKGVFDFKTDLGVSGVFLCLVCPVLFCLSCVTAVWYPCRSVIRATLTCVQGAGRRRVLTFACACLYTAWHMHDTSTHTPLSHTYTSTHINIHITHATLTHTRHSGQVHPSTEQRQNLETRGSASGRSEQHCSGLP